MREHRTDGIIGYNPKDDFIADTCTISKDVFISFSDLWEHYHEYLDTAGVITSLVYEDFQREIAKLLGVSKTSKWVGGKTVRGWLGIAKNKLTVERRYCE